MIIEETKIVNEKKGVDFDISQSVLSQLPFFGCNNILLDQAIQRDIEKYIYCEKFGVPPYKGSYGDQPYKWIVRSFAIRKAIAKKEKKDLDARSRKNNTN